MKKSQWKKVYHRTKQYYYCKQEKGESCGPACVATMAWVMRKAKIEEDIIRREIGRSEGTGGRSEPGRPMYRSFDETGTWEIASVLKKYIAGAAWGLGPWSPHTKLPAVIVVRWNDGSMHWVVAVEKIGNYILCLDPWYGMVLWVPGDEYQTKDARGQVIHAMSR